MPRHSRNDISQCRIRPVDIQHQLRLSMESNRDKTLKVAISAASVYLAQLLPEPPLTYRTELELQGVVLTHEGDSDGTHHPMTIDIRLLFERVQSRLP